MSNSQNSTSVFNASEEATLAALANTFFPCLEGGTAQNRLYPLSADDLEVPRQLIEYLSRLPNQEDITQVQTFLQMVEKRAVNLIIAGIGKPFSQMTSTERERYLLRLATSPLVQLRAAFRGLKSLCSVLFFAGLDANGQNKTWEIIGYPGPPHIPPVQAKPITPLAITRSQTLTCDVVVIGSGAGGGVVAGTLAVAGKDVIVLEKGGYYNEADFNQKELESYQKLYLDGGLIASADKGIMLQAGGCLGGGTVVNWTTSFATPEQVRQEWDKEADWQVFCSPEYEQSTQAILERLGVSQAYNRFSRRDQVMWRGLEKLGWHRDLMPRNVRQCTQGDDCGFCTFGCLHGAKQSTLNTFLQDAYERGARLIVNCSADRILTSNGRASGISAIALIPETGERYELTIQAKTVILAAGAINTPAILLRSGLGGPAVGKYLHLHPATAVLGHLDERIEGWTGVMQGAYSRQFCDLDGLGYGAILETGPIHLALPSDALAWNNARFFKDTMARYRQAVPIIVITRDRDSGRVTVNRQGRPVITYQVSRYDRRHARAAVAGSVRLLEAAGALEIHSLNAQAQVYKPGTSERVKHYMERIDKQGWGSCQMMFYSLHQMGSARMGSNPRTSVVNDYNECHDTPGLFVADASAFPGASGVNPMITTAAIAHRAATFLATRL